MTYPDTWAHPAGQLSHDDMRRMSPEDTERARSDGRLDRALGAPPRPPTKGQLTSEDLRHMTAEQIEAARVNGQLRRLLAGAD